MFSEKDHTFVLCAYKESEFLEACIISLMVQTVKTNVLIATSTPNEHISSLAEKYNLEVFVNTGEKGIAGDWNFAISCAKTELITVAHQDDIYEPDYAEKMISAANSVNEPIICFSFYAELRDNKKVYSNKLLNVKKLMLSPLKVFKKSRFVRRRVLSLGCPICCPAVTYTKKFIDAHPFKAGFKSDLDWQQWEILSRENGSFVYVPEPLMCHRIHEESATTEIIGDNLRSKEDLEMFEKFWCSPVAKLISKMYASSEKSNKL